MYILLQLAFLTHSQVRKINSCQTVRSSLFFPTALHPLLGTDVNGGFEEKKKKNFYAQPDSPVCGSEIE